MMTTASKQLIPRLKDKSENNRYQTRGRAIRSHPLHFDHYKLGLSNIPFHQLYPGVSSDTGLLRLYIQHGDLRISGFLPQVLSTLFSEPSTSSGWNMPSWQGWPDSESHDSACFHRTHTGFPNAYNHIPFKQVSPNTGCLVFMEFDQLSYRLKSTICYFNT